MSEFTGDMTSAVESAFAAASPPDASTTSAVETPAPSATETAAEHVSQEAAPPTETTTTQEQPGPIPYTRFKEVNDKWTTANKELESLGWAKGVNPQLAQSAIQLLTRAQQNPLAFTEELESLRDHPVLGPQLRSWAARTLGFRNAPRQADVQPEAMPEPDLVFEDGRKSYTSEQMAKRDQWLLKQWESKIDEKLSPLAQKTHANEQFVAQQVFDGIKAKANADAKSELDTIRQQYPQFAEHESDVKAAMIADDKLTLKQAWAQVFIDKVGPKLAGQQAAAVKQKVAANTANPSRPSGAASSAPRDFLEALAQHYPSR